MHCNYFDFFFAFTVGLVERLKLPTAADAAVKREFAGTPSFCSLATHNGEHPGAHDDIEAMVRNIQLCFFCANYCNTFCAVSVSGFGAAVHDELGQTTLVYLQVRCRVQKDED